MPFLEPSLEKRLVDNYVTNKDNKLTKEISRLLIGNPEPCDINVYELDLATRNVENTIVFESYIPGVVETAYDYCVMGISMVDSGDKLFGDFHSRARTFLRNLADICGNYEKKHFLVSALVHADVACNFYEDKDKIIYGKALSSRGEIKEQLALLAKDELKFSDAVILFMDSARDKEMSASVVENLEKTYASRRYAFAALREYDASLISSEFQIDLLINAILHMKKSLSLSTEDKQVASAQFNIGKYNNMLFDLTKNSDFLGEAIHYYELAYPYFAKCTDNNDGKTLFTINGCLSHLKPKARVVHKYPKKRKRIVNFRRTDVRKLIMQELEDLG